MTNSEYYERVKAVARTVRSTYSLTTGRVMLSDLQRICRAEKIKIDNWEGKLRKVRGQYFRDEDGARIMVDKSLPKEQRISTLAHELKHHFFYDEDRSGAFDKDVVEKGAEIFAVELIFPDNLFFAAMDELGVDRGGCRPEDIVNLKRSSQTTLSFGSLAKRAQIFGYATDGRFNGIKWLKLQESMYGEPEYKRIRRYLDARATHGI